MRLLFLQLAARPHPYAQDLVQPGETGEAANQPAARQTRARACAQPHISRFRVVLSLWKFGKTRTPGLIPLASSPLHLCGAGAFARDATSASAAPTALRSWHRKFCDL